MTKIYIVRHAEAEGNIYRRIHGHYDGQITENGKLQLEALRERFLNIPLDAVYSSDLTRARSTALTLAEPKGLSVNTDARLREIGVGDWEDVAWGEAEFYSAEMLEAFNYNPKLWNLPNAERYLDVQNRVVEAIFSIAADNNGKSVAVVTHGVAIRTLFAYIRGIILDDDVDIDAWNDVRHIDNTSVSEIEVNAEAHTIRELSYGDNSHLSEALSTFAKQTWWKSRQSEEKRNLYFMPLVADEAGIAFLTEAYTDSAAIASADPKLEHIDEYLDAQKRRSTEYPERIVYAMYYGTPIGLVILGDCDSPDTGKIGFVYLVPEFRGRGFGIQLLGYAVSYFRRLGIHRLQLQVSEQNEKAIRFYLRYGFRELPEQAEYINSQRFLAMEKDI